MSLNRHLTSSSSAHGRLAFHPDCPRCRAERLCGALGSDRLLTLRAQAALAAGVLAFSAAAPPSVALAQEPDQEQEGADDPGAESPGFETDFDPGADYDDPAIEIDPLPDSGVAGALTTRATERRSRQSPRPCLSIPRMPCLSLSRLTRYRPLSLRPRRCRRRNRSPRRRRWERRRRRRRSNRILPRRCWSRPGRSPKGL